jgi:xylulokinase
VAYPLNHPTPEAAEIAPAEIWQAVTAAARQAVRHAAGGQRSVGGVGLSSLTPALVLLDQNDQPLGPFWTHLDRRSRPAARQVWGGVGPEFLHTTGNRPLPGGITAVSYRQQINDDPYLTHRVGSYLHLNGWLGFRLTGVKAFEPGNASFSGLFGTLTDQQWSPRWCEYFEVERAWLPDVIPGDATLGTLQSESAAELNIPAGIPVKLGVPDTSSAILAAGMTAEDLLHGVGTTQVLTVFADRPVPSPQRLTRLLGVGNRFIQVAHNPVGGVALEWIKDLCFRDQSDEEFYGRSIVEAGRHKTSVVLDPPFLGGDRLQIEAHRAGFRDVTLMTERTDLLAAVVAALVQQHGLALQALGRSTRFRRIFLTGGAAAVVRQLIPDYAAAPIEVLDEGSLRGVARLFS